MFLLIPGKRRPLLRVRNDGMFHTHFLLYQFCLDSKLANNITVFSNKIPSFIHLSTKYRHVRSTSIIVSGVDVCNALKLPRTSRNGIRPVIQPHPTFPLPLYSLQAAQLCTPACVIDPACLE